MSDAVEGIGGAITGAITGAVSAVGGVISGIGNAISGAVSGIGKTVSGILKDPLPTLLQIGGAMVGIPPYVTAAVITASRGGGLEDIAKSAAVSYAASSFMSDTQIGADIKNYTTNAWSGDFTDAMMEKFNLPADTAVQISKVASSSLNSALVGGINATLTGKPIGQGITSGFTSGLVYASTDSYFNSINKDPNWGFSDKALNVMKGATSTALNTIISGKGDPAQALGNYIAYATINMGGTSLAQAAKDAYKVLTTDTEAAKAAQDKYTLEKAEYDTKVTKGEELRNSINTDAAAYQKILDEQYNPFKKEYDKLATDNETAVNTFNEQKKIFDDNKWAYDNYDKKLADEGYYRESVWIDNGEGGYYTSGDMVKQVKVESDDFDRPTYKTVAAPTRQSFADAANAAATAANAAAETATSTQTAAQNLYDANKPMLDGLTDSKTAIDKKIADLSVIKKDVEDVTVEGSTAAKLKAASDAYQTKYDAWAKTKDAADRSAENYTKALAEVATRDATIDALNTGAISVTSKNDDGSWNLSNGMTLTTQGKFMQDGNQVFTNAAGIPQKVMDFRAPDGSNVDFNDDAGRVMSETDVAAICKRDYGFTPTEEEAKKLAGGVYTNAVTTPITSLADQKARDAYFTAVGKEPTSDQLSQFRKSGNVIGSAADAAINGLDLPEDYVFPDQNQKLSYAQAYSSARSLGPGTPFSWFNEKTGQMEQHIAESREEKILRQDTAATNAGKYDNQVAAYTKYKLLDNLSSSDFNPADLTKGEMSKFVDAYTKADPLQRAAMLKGSDASTYKVIDTLLSETARYNPTGQVATKFTGTPSGTISAYNPTGVEGILDSVKTGKNVLNAGLSIATADVAGVVTRGAQLLRDSLGLDTATADSIQQMWSSSKDTALKNLGTDNQRVIAGGIASGLESIGAFAASGPVGALMTLGAIAANNSYQEGATTWIDNNGKAYPTQEEAIRAAGQSNIRQLTPEENMKRTAVMTALEIAGEAAGIPGMTRLMKGIPLTGSTGQIVNAVKNFGIGLGNEQVSELLTTTAQMAADKWTSFGLGQNATLADYTKALQDTALATTAAVGTAGSISTATRNMMDLKSYSNPFSTNTGLDSVEPTVPSLKQALVTLGLTENDYATMQRNITNGVRAGNAYVGSAEDLISQTLQSKGMSAVKADAIASTLGEKMETVAVTDFLSANGINAASVTALTPLIQSQLNEKIDTANAAKNIASIFASAGMDPATASKTAGTFFSNTVKVPTITQAEIDLSNQLLRNAGIDLGNSYTSPTGVKTAVTSSGNAVTNDQLQTTFGTTGTTATTGNAAGVGVNTGTNTSTGTGTNTGNFTTTGALTGNTVTTNAAANTGTGTNTGTVTNTGTGTNTGTDAAVANITDLQTNINNRIAELVRQGVTNQEATQQAIREVQSQVTSSSTAVNNRIAELVAQGVTNQEATQQAIREVQGQVTTGNAAVTARISELIAQGMTNQEATNTAIRETQGQITTLETNVNTRINELIAQGMTYQEATQAALKEINADVDVLQTGVTDIKEQQRIAEEERKQAAKVQAAKDAQAKSNIGLSRAMSIIGGAAVGDNLVDTSTPGFKDIGYKTTGDAKFESVLSPFQQMVEKNSYATKTQPQTEQQTQQQLQQAAPVNQDLDPQKLQQEGSDYFNYGTQSEIDQMLGSNPGTQMLYSKAGGLATPLFAGGGSTRYGRYAGGGLPIVEHSGKARIDFRTGNAVTGPGDGQSDDIPAMLADGEFVFPADVVAALGNGSTKAGSDKLYDMMHSIRAYHRSAKPQDLPPPAKKSPLDYLTKPARKARR